MGSFNAKAGDEAKTRARLQRRFPAASATEPPPDIARVIADIVALMRGEARGFEYVRLDMGRVPEFNRKVFAIARPLLCGSPDRAMDLGAWRVSPRKSNL